MERAFYHVKSETILTIKLLIILYNVEAALYIKYQICKILKKLCI